MKTVLCMKWGAKYGPEFVNALYAGVLRHLSAPFRFLCLTDETAGLQAGIETAPLPSLPADPVFLDRRQHGEGWRKLAMFRPETADIEGTVLFLDVDVAIHGDLDRLFDYAPGRFCIIRDWLEITRRPLRRMFDPDFHPGADSNSSVVRFEMPKHGYIWQHFLANQHWAHERFRLAQQYMGAAAGDRAFWPGKWVVSFKRDCTRPFPLNILMEPKEPRDASIIVFHGKPDPDEALAGYSGSLTRRTKPAPWLAESWHI